MHYHLHAHVYTKDLDTPEHAIRDRAAQARADGCAVRQLAPARFAVRDLWGNEQVLEAAPCARLHG